MLALALLVAVADPRLLVLELEPIGVETSLTRSIDPLVLAGAAVDGVSLIAQSEIKTIASVEAEKAQMGCDSSTCLAELAGALGARFVLFGSVSRLGSTTTVALSVYDNTTSTIVRDSLAGDDVGTLPKLLPARVHALVMKALHALVFSPVSTSSASAASVPSAPAHDPVDASDRSAPLPDVDPPSTTFYAGLGCAIVGGAALLAGGTLATLNELTIEDPAGLAGSKRIAQQNGLVGVLVGGGGVELAGIGAVLLVLE